MKWDENLNLNLITVKSQTSANKLYLNPNSHEYNDGDTEASVKISPPSYIKMCVCLGLQIGFVLWPARKSWQL